MPHQRSPGRSRGGPALVAAALVLSVVSVTTLIVTLTPADRPVPAAGQPPTPTIPAPRQPATLAPPTSDFPASPDAPPPPVPLPATHPPVTPTPPGSPPDPLAGPVSDEVLTAELRAQHPTDLDPITESTVLAAANAVLIADLTGTGRDAFPDYLPGEPPARLHTAVRVQAAVAATVAGRRGLVEVRLLWAGTTPTGEAVQRQSARLHLRYHNRTWQPIPATP